MIPRKTAEANRREKQPCVDEMSAHRIAWVHVVSSCRMEVKTECQAIRSWNCWHQVYADLSPTLDSAGRHR
eukprot:1710869-Amphidinium_carterae.2